MGSTDDAASPSSMAIDDVDRAYADVDRTVDELVDTVRKIQSGRRPADTWALSTLMFGREHNLETVQAQHISEWLMAAVMRLAAQPAAPSE
ncbi:hypothetical protein [Kibdelosporangium persicum]|uniref:hypothetical protein n=1 Tax=Kibdelosporangium persicum TaxID=2698649 RepID=UPI0015672244|nr:hypothetical protein [Kibdelosporangium persicum]